MTLPLPHPRVIDGPPGAEVLVPERVQADLEALAQALAGAVVSGGVTVITIPGTGVRAAFGSGTLTWPGGQRGSNIVTVTHGLNRTPVGVWAIGTQDQGVADAMSWATSNYTTTTADVRGVFGAAVPPGPSPATFAWLAIG